MQFIASFPVWSSFSQSVESLVSLLFAVFCVIAFSIGFHFFLSLSVYQNFLSTFENWIKTMALLDNESKKAEVLKKWIQWYFNRSKKRRTLLQDFEKLFFFCWLYWYKCFLFIEFFHVSSSHLKSFLSAIMCSTLTAASAGMNHPLFAAFVKGNDSLLCGMYELHAIRFAILFSCMKLEPRK